MQIVVASGNIFRRELSIFVLSEAGYKVGEAHDAAALLELLAGAQPLLLVVDALLGRANLGELYRQVRERSQAPLLWIASDATDAPALPDSPRDDWVIWPYNPDDLLRRIASLIESAASDLISPPTRQTYAGGRL